MNHDDTKEKQPSTETWSRRTKASHDKPPGVRFVAGELVMLSRKNVASGKIPYFVETHEFTEFDKTSKVATEIKVAKKDDLDRGVPILLIENPKEVLVLTKPTHAGYFGTRQNKYLLSLNKRKKSGHKSWLIRFILDGKMHRMYLTKGQYNRELVRALPIRIKKNYSPGKKIV